MIPLTHDSSRDERENAFLEQSVFFLEKILSSFNAENLSSVGRITSRKPIPIQPIIIEDYRNITPDKRQSLREAYYSEQGVAHYIVLNPSAPTNFKHPLFDITSQLADDLHLYYPLTHPLEGHSAAIARFGPSDGTVKIYNLVKANKEVGYREQGETAEMFSLHNDGLGSGGAVETTALYMDSPALSGGYTFFQNLLRLSVDLARDDMAAFKELFLPEALSQIRPRGKGAIIVKSPVLFLNERG